LGNLTLDASGSITLDADSGFIDFDDNGTNIGRFENSSSNFKFESRVQDKDIVFVGNDGGVGITALTLDMSSGGRANFNNDISLNDGRVLRLGDGDDTSIYNDGSHFNIVNTTTNQDIIFKGNDDGSNITALTLDMSDAGTAIFNHDVKLGDNSELKLGSNDDLKIFCDGSGNYIRSQTSNMDLGIVVNDGGNIITALSFDSSAAGAATFNNDVTAFSDERLKSNITTIPDALSKVTEMRGVHYVRDATGKDSTGVIAQEMQKVAPELVLTADDEMGTLSVNYGNITGYLIEAIKELKAEIEELKAR
jgi:hypothetical protein